MSALSCSTTPRGASTPSTTRSASAPFHTCRHDQATHLWPPALLSFGESWHHLHHADPTSARHGVDRGRPDPSAALTRLLERLGWVHDVNGASWSAVPGRMLVAEQVVRLSRNLAASAPQTIVLLAPGQGRRDLVVVPPDSTKEAAEQLMAATADGHV